jgi:hypothetical protein
MLNKLFKKRSFSDLFSINLQQKKNLTKKVVYYSTDKAKYVMVNIPNNIIIYNNNYENKYDTFEEIYKEYMKNSDSSQHNHNHSLDKIEEYDKIYDFDGNKIYDFDGNKIYDFDGIDYMDDDLYFLL